MQNQTAPRPHGVPESFYSKFGQYVSCVEPCLSFRVRGDRQAKSLRLVMESAKCTHLYHYYQHPEIGLMHIRVQTWFPF